MGAIGAYMKLAADELERVMRDLGKDVRSEDIGEIVKQHAFAGAVSGIGAATLPGAGAVIASGAAITSIVAMYVRLSKALGVTFKEGKLKALASGIVADLSAAVVTQLVLAAAISFIPGVGQAGAAILSTIANFCMVYLAAYIFIKMLSKLLKSGRIVSDMSEEELRMAAREVASETDVKDIVNEAKNQYRENK